MCKKGWLKEGGTEGKGMEGDDERKIGEERVVEVYQEGWVKEQGVIRWGIGWKGYEWRMNEGEMLDEGTRGDGERDCKWNGYEWRMKEGERENEIEKRLCIVLYFFVPDSMPFMIPSLFPLTYPPVFTDWWSKGIK